MSNVEHHIEDYITKNHKEVEGWFYQPDMLLFYYLDHIQKGLHLNGDICELGVAAGRSLILLAMLSRENETVFAMDMFVDHCLQNAQRNMERLCPTEGTGNVEYIVGDSSEYTINSLQQIFTAPLRLLHIDAGHEFHEVLHSLYTFTPFLANEAILIMDDYYDREYPGVEAAIYDFCRHYKPRRFVPFVAGGNKMYMCLAGMANSYQRYLLNQQQYKNTSRMIRVDDYFVLITASKQPMEIEQMHQMLEGSDVPYLYDVDLRTLADSAKTWTATPIIRRAMVSDE